MFCKRCGNCCGIVPFEKKEYKAIKNEAEKLGITFEKVKFANKEVYFPSKAYKEYLDIYSPNVFASLDEIKEPIPVSKGPARSAGPTQSAVGPTSLAMSPATCPFLSFDDKNLASCLIYDKRPEICRDFGTIKQMPCPLSRD